MKRIILTTVLAGLLGSLVYAQNNSDNNTHITSVKAVSTVCGQGRTLSREARDSKPAGAPEEMASIREVRRPTR